MGEGRESERYYIIMLPSKVIVILQHKINAVNISSKPYIFFKENI